MVTLRSATQDDAGIIRLMIRQARINPTGLDWRRFVVATTANDQVIGCVQIKPHPDGTRELASLAVSPAWQGQGIARSLVEHVLGRENGPLYLMCRSGLVPLYTRFGFQVLEPGKMPAEYQRMYNLVRLFQQLLRRGETLAIMYRDGAGKEPGV